MLTQGGGRNLARWAELGFRWAHDEQLGADWAIEYFEVSPLLAKAAGLPEVEQLAAILSRLPKDGPLLPHQAFDAVSQSFPALPKSMRRLCLEAGARIAEANPWALGLFLEAGLRILPSLSGERASVLLGHLTQMATLQAQPLRYWQETTASVAALPAEHVTPLFAWAIRLAGRSPNAAQELLRSGKALGQRLSPEALVRWCQRGEETLGFDEAEGVSYFRLQSHEAQAAITQLSAGVSLREIHDILTLYSQALIGETIPVLPVEATQTGALHPGEGNWDRDQAAIFIPSFVNEYPSKAANFEAIKVLVTHQASHLTFGTYDFAFEGQGSIFTPLRSRLVFDESAAEGAFQRFFNVFADRQLAQTLFTLGEDIRIEAIAVRVLH
jgi:hypothetical protein